jgi:hypothetical protein
MLGYNGVELLLFIILETASVWNDGGHEMNNSNNNNNNNNKDLLFCSLEKGVREV